MNTSKEKPVFDRFALRQQLAQIAFNKLNAEQELHRCKTDPVYFIKTYVKIKKK